jgi:hypothetical protein
MGFSKTGELYPALLNTLLTFCYVSLESKTIPVVCPETGAGKFPEWFWRRGMMSFTKFDLVLSVNKSLTKTYCEFVTMRIR